MRKARNSKLALLLVLAMLATLFVAIPASSAADTYFKANGAYTYITTTGDNCVGGTVTISKGALYDDISSTVADVYATITLPTGVKYMATPSSSTDYVSDTVYYLGGIKSEINFKGLNNLGATDSVYAKYSVSGSSALKIDSSVSGTINATARIWAVNGSGAIIADETYTVPIAKVSGASVTVSGDTPKVVSVASSAYAADITVQESNPGAVEDEAYIYVTLKTPGVKFTSDSYVSTVGITAAAPQLQSDNTVLAIAITNPSVGIAGKVVITPKVTCDPTASTGDIEVKITGTSSPNARVSETTLTVAKVGANSAAAEVKDASDQTVYIGQAKALKTDLSIEPSSGSKLADGKYIVLDLPAGAKWNYSWSAGETPFKTTQNGSSSVSNIVYQGSYNDNRTIWFKVSGDYTSKIWLNDLNVKATETCPAGEVTVTISGNAGVEGTLVIATAKVPVNATADKPQIKIETIDQAAGDITITEAGAGAIPASTNLVLTTPTGVTFGSTPTVKVKDGNIKLGTATVSADSTTLTIPVSTASGLASTIKISDIKFSLSKLTSVGDISLSIKVNDAKVAKVANALATTATSANAVFVLGQSSYTLNGQTVTMDAAPEAINGRTFMPVRFAANAVGVANDNILYDAASKTVTILKGSLVAQFTIGSNELLINGAKIKMDAAPYAKDGRTMLPIRFVGKALGASVTWDQATQTISVVAE